MSVSLELKDYISKARSANMSDAEIRSELLRVGWNALDIDEAILPPPPPRLPATQIDLKPSVSVGTPAVTTEKVFRAKVAAATSQPKKHRSHVLFYILIILMALIGGAVYYALPQIIAKIEGILPVALPVDEDDLQEKTTLEDENTAQKTYVNAEYDFEFVYPSDLELVREVEIYVDGDISFKPIVGDKLISQESMQKIDNRSKCYGAYTGDEYICNASMEKGIGIAILQIGVDGIVNNLKMSYVYDILEDVNVAGMDGKRFVTGFEGDGIETYILDLSDGVTLIFNRDYPYNSAENQKSADLDEKGYSAMQEILSTIVVSSQATSTTP